jgi:penicillin-binding protein 1A
MTKKKAKISAKKWVVLFWLAVLLPVFGFALLLTIASNGDLPPTEALANPKTNLATEVYTCDKKVIGSYYRENRSDIKYQNLPPHIVDALISTEDARFYEHSGIDFIGLMRATVYLGSRGGGSTITQQLSKMLFTEDFESIGFLKRALIQKPREWIIAAQLEKQYTKDEIITLYLNRYDFLNQAVGIKSAAHVYFNKPVDSLNIQESAMLVGMLKNSSLYNPIRRADTVLFRRNVVLGQMVSYGFLSEEERDSIKLLPLALDYQRVSHDEGLAPYFREVLRQELKDIINETDENGNLVRTKPDGSKYDLYGDGLKVYTTIDSRTQEHAEHAVRQHLAYELQDVFWKDLSKRKDANWPFYNGIENKDKDNILNAAVNQSHRHMVLTGRVCPDCNRPSHYIVTANVEGIDHFHCDESKGGCSHYWPKLSVDSVDAIFNTPTPMKIFTHFGNRDTVMSPMDSIKYHKSILHASLMAMEPSTGHIKAWVGGIDYKHFQFDNVSQSRRQVGSTFKPFVYATALRFNKYHICDELPNQKICIDMPDGQPQWCPDNSDFQYGDMCTLKFALANSINTITAQLIKDFGPEPVVQLAHELGIKGDIPAVPSIALGVAQVTLHDMVAANSALVNHGVYIEPVIITRIEDKNGNQVYDASDYMIVEQALDPRTAFLTVELLRGVVDGAYSREKGKKLGTGVRLRADSKNRDYDGVRIPLAGKTGTTQNNTDGWFMGLTPDLVTGVWVGAQDPTVRFSRTDLGQGANTALPIFGFFIKDMLADPTLGFVGRDFERPEGIDIDMDMNCQSYYERANSSIFGNDPEESSEGIFD